VSTPQTLAILSAPEDASFVSRLAADLGAVGYHVIDVASERLHEDPCSEPGELRRRLEPAHAVLVVLSPNAIVSEQVRCEIEFAQLLDPPDAPKRLVPLLLTTTDVPYSLKNNYIIQFTPGPYDAALEHLKNHLTAEPSDAFANPEMAPWPSATTSVAPAPAGVAVAPAPSLARTRRTQTPVDEIAPAANRSVEVQPAEAMPPLAPAKIPPPASTPERLPKRSSFWRALFSRKSR
jgi:hypothetical protein